MRIAPNLTASAAPIQARRARRAGTLTAAGDAATSGSVGTSTVGRGQTKMAWQTEGWNYFDVFPELHYGAQFVGSCYSRIVLRLGWMNDANEVESVFDEDGNIDADCPVPAAVVMKARGVLHAFRDPLGGTSTLLEGVGKNMTVAGELHLVAIDYHNTSGAVVARAWEVLSTDEIRKKKDIRRDRDTGKPLESEFERVIPGGRTVDIPKDAFVLRVYRKHPRWSHLADAATRPLLDTMEVLVLLTRQLRASILSRLAGAGVLFMPTEIDFPDDDTAAEGTEEDNGFARALIKYMSTPITDRGNASSVVPLVVQADADLISSIHHLTFDSKDDDNAIAKMDAMLLRFAQGSDLPVEVILGHQSTTFANAVQIDESTYKAHIEPGVNIFCGFLTAGYLWPSLGAPRPADAPFGQTILLPIQDDPITRLVIIADSSALVTHENREENAIKAMSMKPPLIKGSTGRRALGFTDADAPDPAELAEWIRVQQLIRVSESIKATEEGTGGISLADPEVQAALDAQLPSGSAPST